MIVLDTHVWVWWVDANPRLHTEVRARIDAEPDIRLCSISILEIATATSLGRLELKPSVQEWMDIALSLDQLTVEPLTPSLCIDSVSLPDVFHRDPADRLIVALARQLNADLITSDHKILGYPQVRTVEASA